MADALPLTLAINAWEGRWPLNTYADLDAGKLSAPARERLKTAEAMTQGEYRDLIARRAAVRATYDKVASRYDAFATLGACGAAPVGLGSTGNTIANVGARCSAARADAPVVGRGPAARAAIARPHGPGRRAV
jgi:hypothetical protein